MDKSTHNFIDPQVSKKSGSDMEAMRVINVTVADGNKLMSEYKCPGFRWKIQREEFTTNLRVLPLGGCDLAL